MKKAIFTIVIAICTVAFVNAQDLTSKKGVPILPQAGDYAIGINAVPFFEYFGDMFNGTAGNAAPDFNFRENSPMAISGKYFKDANTAYRVNFRIGNVSMTDKELVQDVTSLDSLATVTDKFKNSETNIVIGFGLEKRRGHGRVQGIYGAEAAFMIMMEKDKNTWGNDLSSTNTNGGNARMLEQKYPMGFGLGVRGFVGVEYFFAPCISIGGEFGWGIAFMSMGKGTKKYEKWNGVAVVDWERETGGGSIFYIDTDNWGGAINLNFYF